MRVLIVFLCLVAGSYTSVLDDFKATIEDNWAKFRTDVHPGLQTDMINNVKDFWHGLQEKRKRLNIEDIIIDEADKWIKKVEEEIKVLKEVTNVDELPSELRYLYEKFQSSPIAEDFVRFMTEHTQTEVSKAITEKLHSELAV